MDNVIYICRICVEQNESLKTLSEVNVECVNDYLSILNVLKILVGFEVIIQSDMNISIKRSFVGT